MIPAQLKHLPIEEQVHLVNKNEQQTEKPLVDCIPTENAEQHKNNQYNSANPQGT